MCIGNKQKLKNKFGKGFEIDIKTVKIPNEQYQIQLNNLNRKPKDMIESNMIETIILQLGGTIEMY